MSLFDYYQPSPAVHCPLCAAPLVKWQGKQGPNGIFVWRQGEASPVEQRVDEDMRVPLEVRAEIRLPERFVISSRDCPRHQPIEADCRTRDSVWSDTTLRAPRTS